MDPKKPFWKPWPLKSKRRIAPVNEPASYRGTKTLKVVSNVAASDWCRFFEQPSPIRTLILAVKCSQRLFTAACHQRELTSLYIFWGPINDLAPLRGLKKLERLFLGSCSITDLTPIKSLKNMQHLSLQNLDRMSDYSAVANLKKLEYLQIDGAPFMPKNVWIDDLQFLRRLPNLRGLSMMAVRFRDPNYADSFKGLKLECLDFRPRDNDTRNRIIESLPNLRYGTIFRQD